MMDVHLLAAFVLNQLIAATAMNLQHQAVVWYANKEGVELQFFVINDIDLWYEFPIWFIAWKVQFVFNGIWNINLRASQIIKFV